MMILFNKIIIFFGISFIVTSTNNIQHLKITCCGTCVGSASCHVCKTCEYCNHCNSGGSCGVSGKSKNDYPIYNYNVTPKTNYYIIDKITTVVQGINLGENIKNYNTVKLSNNYYKVKLSNFDTGLYANTNNSYIINKITLITPCHYNFWQNQMDKFDIFGDYELINGKRIWIGNFIKLTTYYDDLQDLGYAIIEYK